MTMQESDHAQWLRKYATHVLRHADTLEDEARRLGTKKQADRMFKIANALEVAMNGHDPFNGSGSGSRAMAQMTKPGTLVNITFLTGEQIAGQLGLTGRFDMAFHTNDGRTLVIPKHSILFYDHLGYEPLPAEETDGATP